MAILEGKVAGKQVQVIPGQSSEILFKARKEGEIWGHGSVVQYLSNMSEAYTSISVNTR